MLTKHTLFNNWNIHLWMFVITMEIHRYCIPSHLPPTDNSRQHQSGGLLAAGLLSNLTTLERVSKIYFAIISIITLLVLLSKYSKDCTNKRKLSPIKIPLFMIYNYITFDICRNCNVLHCFLLCFSQVGSIAVFFHWKSLNICKRKFISIYRKIKLPYH